MYLAYSAKLLSYYPDDTELPIPELPGWTFKRLAGRGNYSVTHNLRIDKTDNISITGIPLDADIAVNVANIEADSFLITAQKNGEDVIANIMFVLVVKG